MGKKGLNFEVNDRVGVRMTVSEAAMKVYGELNKFYAVPKASLVDVTNNILNSLGFLRGERQKGLRP